MRSKETMAVPFIAAIVISALVFVGIMVPALDLQSIGVLCLLLASMNIIHWSERQKCLPRRRIRVWRR